MAGVGRGRATSRPFTIRRWLLAVCCVLATARLARPGDVRTVWIVSPASDRSPYREAIHGFRQALDESQWRVQVLAPADATAQAREAGPPQWLVPLGPAPLATARQGIEAARRVFALAESDVCALTASPAESGVVLRIDAEQLVDALLAASPRVTSVGYLKRSDGPACSTDELRRAIGNHAGLEAVEVLASNTREALQGMREHRTTVSAWVLLPDPVLMTEETIEYAIQVGLQYRVPVVGFNRPIAAGGALLALSLDPEAVGQQTAELLAHASEVEAGQALPERQLPAKTQLIINLKTARLLRLEIPAELTNKAAERIE